MAGRSGTFDTRTLPRTGILVAVLALAGMAACGTSSGGSDAIDPDAAPDSADVAPGPDTLADAVPDAADLPADLASDPAPDAPCLADAWTCSDDAALLRTCKDGAWVETDCARTRGQLCENGACVDPWRYGSPQWDTCPDEPRATTQTMAEKAAYFSDVAWRLHFAPKQRFILSARLKRHEVDCTAGATPPCYAPDVPEDTATWADVDAWDGYENEGGDASHYATALALEWSVTRAPETLARLKTVLAGVVDRMRVTGVPGLFTRQMVPPGVAGNACPADDAAYQVDPTKTTNKWVKVGDDGCIHVVDAGTHAWTATTHCGLDAYKGWCWLDNISQDEYTTHMNALGVVAKVADDPEVQATIRDLIVSIADHLVAHDLTVVDWDGKVTRYGRFYATSLNDSPGFLAAIALDFIRMGATLSGRADLEAFYQDCLLQRSGPNTCLPWPMEQEPIPYTDWLAQQALYVGGQGCGTNYDNVSMLIATLYTYIWFETDPAIRLIAQQVLDTQVMRPPDQPRAVLGDLNAWYDFMWASQKRLGPGSDGPAYQAVHDAVCSLKQFPARKHPQARDNLAVPEFCQGDHGQSMAEAPIPVADRCLQPLMWWYDPHERKACTDQPWVVYQPVDYLMAYWMGRYYGFIPAGL